MTYYGNVNPDLLAVVPLDAQRMLELGCGDGALAATYRSRNPKVHYTAVEAHGPAADKAAAHVDRLVTGDFESLADAELGSEGAFDAIILGDVLEHMRDPDQVLRRLHGLLADDGHLVLSVPNVAHWTAFYHLMHGQWPAQDSGLFDRTHLRFFTLASLTEAIMKAGFKTVKRAPRQFLLAEEEAKKWIPPLADLAQKMGIKREEFVSRASTLQYVVLAAKADRPNRPRLHLHMGSWAPDLMDVRTRLPAEYLGSVPELSVRHEIKPLVWPELPIDTPKIFIAQRPRPPSPEQWITGTANLIRHGWIVVYETDDHPDLIAKVNGHSTSWSDMMASHAVQTSTEALASVFRSRNPEVMAFSNAAFTLPPFPARRPGMPRIFFGAANREKISAAVARSLEPLLKKYPKVMFEVVHDRAFFEALPTRAKTFSPTLPYDDYLAAMARCDIALLPLEGTEGEGFKSDLKWVEAASRGLAVVASPCVYAESIRDGETGLIAESVADWAPALGRLIASPPLRRSIAQSAWQEVQAQRMFAYQANARRDWYLSLWARRAEIEADLLRRVPQLAQALGR